MIVRWIETIGLWITYTFMPITTCYHLVSSNIFLNTASEDATGLERWGNLALSPVQYLMAGEIAVAPPSPEEDYSFVQRFDYHEYMVIKTAGSLIALPVSLTIGCLLKGAAYCSEEVRQHHQRLFQSRFGPFPQLSLERYRHLGIEVNEHPDQLLSLGYERREEDERIFKKEKKALKQILALLQAQGILCWADCGTCLGVYRYGGAIPWDFDIDIAVLQPDFSHIKRTLYALPREKYLVEDWSNRLYPGTLLKVYVRKTREYIDIYHFAVDPEKRTVHFILSNADSWFMPTSWKLREQRFTVETPFDFVFPLKIARFDGIPIPVPNQTEKYLQQRYGEDLSPVKIYDKESKQYINDPSHPYWQRPYAH